MDNRKWESGASINPPAVPVAPSSGYPTDGDPLAPIPPTLPGAFWFHQMGEEIRAVLTAAGITPSTADTAQLLLAIEKLIEARSGNYALDTGAANAYVIALSPAITAYTGNFSGSFKAVNANNGACTLNAGGGVIPLVNDVGGALVLGDILAGDVMSYSYIAADNKVYITSTVQSQIRFSREFESAELVFALNAAVSAAHGLGVVPKLFKAVLRCKTAEGGYSVGDEVDVTSYSGVWQTGYPVSSCTVDATNITWAQSGSAFMFAMKNATNGFSVTAANWKLILRAWK